MAFPIMLKFRDGIKQQVGEGIEGNIGKEDLCVPLGMGLRELQKVICFRAVDGTRDWICKCLGRGEDSW